MRNRLVAFTSALATAALLLWIVIPAASQTKAAPAAQTAKPPAATAAAAKAPGSGKVYSPPRLADGHPDLQGTYDVATVTPVERPAGLKAFYTPEETAKLETARALQRERGDQASDPNRPAPTKGGNVGGYNSGWLDPGSKYTVVNGEARTSLIVDPTDGRVPASINGGERGGRGGGGGGGGGRGGRGAGAPTSDAAESNDPGLETAPGAYDDPERRPLGERCMLGFGSTSGPPALPDYFYNNLHQIVQTKDAVMILTEMVHDVRVVRMNAQHLPTTVRQWMGDSVGRWEGDTLVVDTTNFTDKTRFRGASQNLHVIERFTRTGDKTLLYRFTIDDPTTWTKQWTGEYTWPATDQHIYEYACPEANYALGGILSGARMRDKDAAEKATAGGK